MSASPIESSDLGAVPAPSPIDETSRIKKLLSYQILDTETETAYNDAVRIAAHICDTPIALVSLVDVSRQWFKAAIGLDAAETHRDLAFCAYAILQTQVMVVPDALADKRFANNPLVLGDPFIRFYAGAPLVTSEGYALGTLCVIDTEPKQLNEAQIRALESLSRQVVNQMETRLLLEKAQQETAARKRAETTLMAMNGQLEQRVRDRTRSLAANNKQLQDVLQNLQQAQAQLIHSEKMTALGQMVSGIAHEINNPVGFIHGNLGPIRAYTHDLIELLHLYERSYPHANADIRQKAEEIEIDFIQQDIEKILSSMSLGTERIRKIVLSLRNFSRKDESVQKPVDIHDGIESTLMLLGHRLKAQRNRPAISINRNFGTLPLVECCASQLNQVFMNILANAIDAFDNQSEFSNRELSGLAPSVPSSQCPQITVSTHQHENTAIISIADNGPGMTKSVKDRIFEPFFTTKDVGHGTGIGMTISYQIIKEKHGGELICRSEKGRGSELVMRVPIQLSNSPPKKLS